MNYDINTNETNNQFTTNCLALTIRKDYRLTIVSNIIRTSKRISFKILLSILGLNIFNIIL